MMKEGRVSSKGEFFAEYMGQYFRKGNGGRDTTENQKITTMNLTWLT
jgi:hypothetical protein